jgi:hypothetical protein
VGVYPSPFIHESSTGRLNPFQVCYPHPARYHQREREKRKNEILRVRKRKERVEKSPFLPFRFHTETRLYEGGETHPPPLAMGDRRGILIEKIKPR